MSEDIRLEQANRRVAPLWTREPRACAPWGWCERTSRCRTWPCPSQRRCAAHVCKRRRASRRARPSLRGDQRRAQPSTPRLPRADCLRTAKGCHEPRVLSATALRGASGGRRGASP
eukprot:3701620-Pleurochrysis_carterae.AAC.2